MRQAARPPFADGFDPNQPRGKDGKWVPVGRRIEEVAGQAGLDRAAHTDLGQVKDIVSLSKIVGRDVRGFRHSVSNQAIQHMRNRHPDLTAEDWGRLPEIVRIGTPTLSATTGVNGVPRITWRATIQGRRYEYVAEYRRRARRLDAITLYQL